MADVLIEKGGKRGYIDSERLEEAKARGWVPATSAASSALTGAQAAVSLGKDDDLAGGAAALGAAVQQDLDKGDYANALKRIAVTVGPAFAPAMGPAGVVLSKVQQHFNEKAAPGVAEEASAERRAQVAEARAANPGAFTGGAVGGALLTAGAGTAPTKAAALLRSGSGVGLSAPVAALAERVAPRAGARALAAIPIGAVTGAEMTEGDTVDKAVGGFVGGLTAGVGGAAIPAVGSAISNEVRAAGRTLAESGERSAANALTKEASSFGDSLRGLVTHYEKAPDIAKAAINAKTGGVVGLLASAGRALLGKAKDAETAEARAAVKGVVDEIDDILKGGEWKPPTTSSSATAPAPRPVPVEAPTEPVPTFTTGRPQGGSYSAPAEPTPAASVEAPTPAPPPPEVPQAAPVETSALSPAARRARLNDDEVATLLKSTAREHGTLDAATLASKAGLSSSQVTRALPKIATRRFAAEIEAIAAAKAPAPSTKPPAADLLEGIAAQNKGGKVTPVTLRQEAAVQREAAQAVTIGDFADKLLKSRDRGAFLRMLKKEKGVDFAHKVAKAAGVSTKGI